MRFGVTAVLALVVAYAGARTAQAARAGIAGKQALLAAERAVDQQRVDEARRRLVGAKASFEEVDRNLRGLGPLLPVARVVPLVRVQVRGAEAFAGAGALVADAGLDLVGAVSGIVEPADVPIPAAGALGRLQGVRASLARGATALERATGKVHDLDGYRLLGPLAGARDDLRRNLDRIGGRAASAQEGLDALIAFAGGAGPRRYLLFSQNPDEVRPTGGYMGTYGVLVAGPDTPLALERYEPTENWTVPRPQATVPPEQQGSPFRFHDPPIPQSLANVNATPDWPAAARLAMDLWQRGGEEPVDGVLSTTPGFLARVLAVVGPVEVPDFGETVTAANVRERFDFYTREAEARTPAGRLRKEFVADLAKQVVGRLLATPSRQWVELGAAVGQSFEQRQVMAWSTDGPVTTALVHRGWDGTLPAVGGDFFYDAEFEYAAKNGRALRRTFDHRVELNDDGSALITTVVTVANTEGPRPFNPSSLAYHTVYGPLGSVIQAGSDTDAAPEPALRGHPAAGFFRGAPPLGTDTLKVVWRAPEVAKKLPDGSWAYGLWFMHLPDHQGDVVNLDVVLPKGMRWTGGPPPARTGLDTDLIGVWRYGR